MSDRRAEFSISCRFSDEGDFWLISQATWETYKRDDGSDGGYWSFGHGDDQNVVFKHPYSEGETLDPPQAVRAEYERLIGYDPDYDPNHAPTLGEICFTGDDEDEQGGFNQPCRFGNLAPGHKVYCTNAKWLYAPGKCCRTWYTGGEVRDEDCEGYQPNQNLIGGPPSAEDQSEEHHITKDFP